MGAVQLDPVEARLDADARRLREAVEHVLDLGARHPVRDLALAGGVVVEAPERLEVLARVGAELRSEVIELLDDLRPVPVDRGRHCRQLHTEVVRVVDGVAERVARRVDVHRLEEDHSGSTGRAPLLVGDVAAAGDAGAVEVQERPVGGEGDPITDLDRADLDRR